MDDIDKYRIKCKALGIEPLSMDIRNDIIRVVQNRSYKKLDTCIIPKFVDEIGNLSFEHCSRLKDVVIKGKAKLGKSSFGNCINLENIEVDNVEYIEEDAFFDCKKLRDIKLDKVKYIGKYAFCGCESIKKANIKDVRSI